MRMCGGEAVAARHTSEEASIEANEAIRPMPTYRTRAARHLRAEQGDTAKQRRLCPHRASRTTMPPLKRTPGGRHDSQRMYARSATVSSVGRADTAIPYVRRR